MNYIIGLRAIEVWILKAPERSILLMSRESKRNVLLSGIARDKNIKVEKISDDEITRRTGTEDHKGIALGLPPAKEMDETDIKTYLSEAGDQALLLFLDGITDSHNVGAILRSAEQFSADAVILPKRRGAGVTAGVSKTSAGADAVVPIIRVVNFSRVVEEVKKAGFWVYGADMDGEPITTTNLTGKVALVLGSEDKGVGQNLRKHCDGLISIPATGVLDSLNVSVAAGIFLYEIRRQQG